MPAEITDIDRSMISNMMLTKSYSDIAKALDLTKDDIGAVVLELTLGTSLVPYELKLKERWEKKNKARPVKKYRPGAKEIVKSKQPSIAAKKVVSAAAKKKSADKAFADSIQKQKNQAAKVQLQNHQAAQAAKRRPSLYKTIAVDYTRQQTLRIDRKTTIYVKPGEDPAKVRERFIKNYKHLLIKTNE